MLARLNGVLGGVLGGESFALSQSFYYGRVEGAPFAIYQTEGKRIDDLPELDAGAMGKQAAKAACEKGGDTSGSGIGFRFLCDKLRRGSSEDDAREAIEADDGDAGEWWGRVDDRQKEDAGRLLHNCGVRFDAGEAAHFARQLEFVKAQTYDIAFGRLKSLSFLPLDTSAPEGAESITYRQWDEVHAAKVIANMADDLPQVDVFAREFTSPVSSLGAAYQWSIQDIRRAALAGSQFDLRKARAARMSIDRRIDEIGAFGIPEKSTTGFLNNANVPIFVLPNAGAWTGLTPLQVLANMNALAQSVVDATLEVEEPNTMILDTTSYGHVASTPISGGDGTDTILTVFLRNSPYITSVQQWSKLNTAGAASVPRAVVYDRSDRVLTYNIPLLFEQLPPQARNLSFVVSVHSRVGVVEMHYPLAIAYADIA